MCCPAIHKEFDAGDEAAVIRGEKKDRLGNFFRRAGPAQRSRGRGLRLELFDLLIAQSKLCLVASGNDRSRTHHVDPNVAALEVYRPCPRERSEGRFRRSVNSERGEPLIDTIEPVMTIALPADISGKAFWTVKSVP